MKDFIAGRLVGVRLGMATFLGQSIGIYDSNTFQFSSSFKTVGATVLGGLWALDLRCIRS